MAGTTFTFVYNPAAEDELKSASETLDALEAMAEAAAGDTEANSPMAQAQPGRYGSLQVTREEDGVVLYTDGSFAHIDEFGGAYSGPSAAMRRAVAAQGEFEEH